MAAGSDMTFTTKTKSTGGGGGGGGGGSRSTPTPVNGTGSIDLSGIMSRDGLFEAPATLRSQDGKALLSIATDTEAHDSEGNIIKSMTVSEVDNFSLLPPPPGLNIIPAGYNFEPSGAAFTPALSLTLKYNPASLNPGSELIFAYYDTDLKSWTKLPEYTVDNNTITANIDHFTVFAILEKLAPVPVTTPTPTPETTPTPVVTPTPTPTAPITPGISPTPVPPKTPPVSPAPGKASNTLWVIIIAVLIVILLVAAAYLVIRRRKKQGAGTEFSIGAQGKSEKAQDNLAVQPGEKDADTALYTGTVNLTIRPPVFVSQVRALEKCLRESPDLRVDLIGGSSTESNIIISIDKQKPVMLINVLRAMPPVKQVITKNNQIIIVLNPQ